MRVLIPVLDPVHKNCDIIALVLDTDMNYDSNTPYNVITKIQRQTLMILLRIMGLYIWDIWKPLLVSYYKDNIHNKGKTKICEQHM